MFDWNLLVVVIGSSCKILVILINFDKFNNSQLAESVKHSELSEDDVGASCGDDGKIKWTITMNRIQIISTIFRMTLQSNIITDYVHSLYHNVDLSVKLFRKSIWLCAF